VDLPLSYACMEMRWETCSLAFWETGDCASFGTQGKKQEEAETTKESKKYQNKHKKSWPLLFIAPALPDEYSAVPGLKSAKV
jgi:hypothetical protein